eukprot:gene12475-26242_t
MLSLFWQLFYFVISIELCPISSKFKTEYDNMLPYTEDYFPNITISPSLPRYNCPGHTNTDPNKQECIEKLCPIKEENVASALESMSSWANASSRLCNIVFASNKILVTETPKTVIRLIILGGSFTVGSNTKEGCCCKMDVKCANKPCEHYSKGNDDPYCAWSGFLYRWLQTEYPHVDFIYHNFASSGLTSFLMADRVLSILAGQSWNVTANDIVFVDHTVNDAEYRDGTRSHALMIKQGIETIIRRIVHHFGKNRPQIVLLDLYPHDLSTKTGTLKYDPNSVTNVYKNVAKHYNLPLWSYRDVVWSNYASTNQAALVRRLKGYSTHPPWHVHLFIADILAGCVKKTLETCRSSSSADKGKTLLSTSNLPAPLYDVGSLEKNMCDMNKPMLLEVTSSSKFHPENVDEYEKNISSSSSVGWREYVDYHGVAGFMINKHSHPQNRSMTFIIKDIGTNLITMRFMIKVEYLKTYKNAGKVQVHLCGTEVMNGRPPDALHTDHLHYKVSVPDIMPYELTYLDKQRCDSLPVDKRTLEVRYVLSTDRLDVRKDQKFKLISLRVCVPSDEI